MKKIAIALFILLVSGVIAQAQADSEKLSKIPKLLKEKIGKEMPGWAHHSIEPMEGSKNVIIEQWELLDVAVKVAVTQYDTAAEAARALKDFRAHLKVEEDATSGRTGKDFHLVKEDLPFMGDEGLTWDIRGTEAVVLRKSNFVVYVSIIRPEHHYDLALSKQFAKHVVDVLSVP